MPHEFIASLLEADTSMRERAALRLYESADFRRLMSRSDVSAALRASVTQGNRCAAALLLLAYDASAQAASLLDAAADEGAARRTKLQPWGPVVAQSLVTDLALSLRGAPDCRARLLLRLEDAPAAEWQFLLDVLRDIDDPTLLHAIARTLDDSRTVVGGVPSAVQPQRRMADLAVDAFIARLSLHPGFRQNPSGRYADVEVAQVKQLVKGAIPS